MVFGVTCQPFFTSHSSLHQNATSRVPEWRLYIFLQIYSSGKSAKITVGPVIHWLSFQKPSMLINILRVPLLLWRRPNRIESTFSSKYATPAIYLSYILLTAGHTLEFSITFHFCESSQPVVAVMPLNCYNFREYQTTQLTSWLFSYLEFGSSFFFTISTSLSKNLFSQML